MSKKKAFLIHLAASLFVFSIILMLIIYVWYPAPYFDTDYRMQWIMMIAFVDIVLGPGLTLLIYRVDKPNLRFDMSAIVILQLTALGWGVGTAWSAHPLTNVFFDGQIYCLDKKQVETAGVDKSLVTAGMSDRVMLVLPYPDTSEKKTEYLASLVKGQPIVFALGHLFEAADTEVIANLDELQANIIPLIMDKPSNIEQWKIFMSDHDAVNKDWRYYQFHCFKKFQIAVLDRKNNKIEGIMKLELPPFWNYK